MSGQNLVSQLLGLNHEQGSSGSFGGGDGRLQGGVSKKSGMGSVVRSMKLSHLFHGINVTPNFLFLVLFLGFTAWLGVVYFVRHHEPLANDVLGVGAARSATSDADRRLVAGIKRVLPVRTSESTGDFYVPIPQGGGRLSASGDYGYANNMGAAYGQPVGNMGMPLPPPPVPAPTPVPPEPTPLSYYPYAAAPQQQYAQPQRDAYLMPVHAAAGTRVKMIVNR
jgi:hypothetical protein